MWPYIVPFNVDFYTVAQGLLNIRAFLPRVQNAEKSHFVYSEIEEFTLINAAVIQPNNVTNTPWLIPIAADLLGDFKPAIDPYIHAPIPVANAPNRGGVYPLVPGLAIARNYFGDLIAANYDPLFRQINQVLTGPCFLQHFPDDLFEQENQPICRSTLVDAEFTEPLLGFCGMSQMEPSSIFPIVRTLPPLIQDYELQMFKEQVVKYKDFSPSLSSAVTLELTPKSGYELTIYSQDGFKQAEKGLQKVDMLYPEMKSFTNTVSAGDILEVEFETHWGPPDYVFIHVERVSKPGEVFDQYQPAIDTVSLEFFNHDIRTVSDLDKVQLYNATRRNSNVRTDVRVNRRKVGGVLFTPSDLGNWSRYSDFTNVDTFRGKFVVNVSDVDESYTDDLEPAEKTERDQLDRTVKLLLIYEKFGLTGVSHNMRFWVK